MIKSSVVEMLGTLAIVLFTSLKSELGEDQKKNQTILFETSLAVFLITLGIMYMGVTKSGSQYNPMLSIALLIIGEIDFKIFIVNVIGQAIGATIAQVFIQIFTDSMSVKNFYLDNYGIVKIIILEMIICFFITNFYLFTFINKKSAKGSFAFTIAGALAFLTLSVGPFYYSRFNIFYILMPSLVSATFSMKVIFVVIGNLLGGLAAAFFYRFLYENDLRKEVEIIVDESEQEVKF